MTPEQAAHIAAEETISALLIPILGRGLGSDYDDSIQALAREILKHPGVWHGHDKSPRCHVWNSLDSAKRWSHEPHIQKFSMCVAVLDRYHDFY